MTANQAAKIVAAIEGLIRQEIDRADAKIAHESDKQWDQELMNALIALSD